MTDKNKFQDALNETQRILAAFRDKTDYIHPVHGFLSLEEFKYTVIDPLVPDEPEEEKQPKPINLNNRDGYMEAVASAKAVASDVVSEGDDGNDPEKKCAGAHVTLDAINCLETAIRQGHRPWQGYSQ